MSKVTFLCIIAFLLLSSLTHAARPDPAFHDVTPMKTQNMDDHEVDKVDVEENCAGVGEDECLMRRTLAANLDYIYTQKQGQP
ncbi:hypothetical protein RJ640_018618 [Escallonia rubra]|uniref:Phytosulfokine n=1 Tax=Escallonia rubra TaxID=112253 RepID=A0AA88U1W1_9ASTE|nr:hypothetical protein RJ640_018615 [Escallonia rubra]KAK2976935.1 hypothetical protein RJ640_018618 [Escallonia rubra]